jgi:hypothetical protein
MGAEVTTMRSGVVIPAEAGIASGRRAIDNRETPAFAGVTI